jgi:hypothetical protein
MISNVEKKLALRIYDFFKFIHPMNFVGHSYQMETSGFTTG